MSRTRCANRTHTDAIINTAFERWGDRAFEKWTYLSDVPGQTTLTALVAAARYLEVEYGAVEYQDGTRTVRLVEDGYFRYLDHDRNFAYPQLWPSDRAKVEAGLVEVRVA